MKELYEQLGLVSYEITKYQQTLNVLIEQKKYLIKTIEDYANQSLYSETGRNGSAERKHETNGGLDNHPDTPNT